MPAQAWVTLVVGLTAITGVIITWRQKNDADRRSEWWRRVAWAYERVFDSDDTQQRLGWTLLKVLGRFRLRSGDRRAHRPGGGRHR